MRILFKYTLKFKKYILFNIIGIVAFILVQLGIPTLFEEIIDFVLPSQVNAGNPDLLWGFIVKMIIISVIGFLGQILMSYSIAKISTGVVSGLREDLYRKLQSLSHYEFGKFGASSLTTSITSDAYQLMFFLQMCLRMGMISPIMIISSISLILTKDKNLALVVMLAIPVLLLAVFFIGKFSAPLSYKQQHNLDQINLKFKENLTGLRVIRAFGNEDIQSERFGEVSAEYGNVSKKIFRLTSIAQPGFSLIFSSVIIIIILLGSRLVGQNMLSSGELNTFIEYIFHVLISFMMFAVLFIMYPRASVSAKRIDKILAEQPSIHSGESEAKISKDEKVVLSFENVTYFFPAAEKPVIKNVNLSVKSGETLAIIGSTGSGKSTLLQLIPRFYDVSEGSIKINGIDIREMQLDHLRDLIGFSPQKAALFTGSIRDNIAFGQSGAASDEEIMQAAEIAQASDFISSKKEGLDFHLAEGGRNLSGGQKQRISIARSIIKKPNIYIFDDSFSALDYQTDANLRAALKPLTKNAIQLIVAQRVGTIMNADQIIVMENGEIVGVGTHLELLKICDVYKAIAASQLTKGELSQ